MDNVKTATCLPMINGKPIQGRYHYVITNLSFYSIRTRILCYGRKLKAIYRIGTFNVHQISISNQPQY